MISAQLAATPYHVFEWQSLARHGDLGQSDRPEPIASANATSVGRKNAGRVDETECFLSQSCNEKAAGETPGCFSSITRGYTMPSFSFEKISPPVRHDPTAPAAKKPQGFILQLLERFTERRAERLLRKELPDSASQRHSSE
jgi:hypothetical protein